MGVVASKESTCKGGDSAIDFAVVNLFAICGDGNCLVQVCEPVVQSDQNFLTRRTVKSDGLLIDCSGDLDPPASFLQGRGKPVERLMPHIILFPNNASRQGSA